MISPSGIDHLVLASPSLEKGMDDIERLLGVKPIPGGRHPQYGTHNALLSLGPSIYLEIIARDPELPVPDRNPLVDLRGSAKSRIVTWVYRTPDIEGAYATASQLNIGLGPVETGSRTQPDGTVIRWQLTDPYAMPMGGVIPFLINWGDTPHPSTVLPNGGKFRELIVAHPDAEKTRTALAALGADISVVHNDHISIVAKINTANGVVTLR